ncbi:hypothetical protein CRI70_24840 [Streptomyces sp. Ru87]|nr:hypothetical protein CRI70_24840 [Streptomyces sp. Ru87]
MMWVWELRLHDYEETLRWLRQRCSSHMGNAVFEACDVELVQFDPMRHDDFILGQPPAGYDILPDPANGDVFQLAEPKRTLCATDGCGNGTVIRGVVEGWKCFKCMRTEKRREATRQRWQR